MKPNLISQQAEILFQRDRKKTRVELSPLVFLCGKLVIFELWGGSVPPQQPLSPWKRPVSSFGVFFGLFSHFHATVLQLVFVTWTVKICVLVCKQLTSRLQPHEWACEALSWIQCPYDTVTCCQWQMVTWWRLAGHVHHLHDFSLACFINSIMLN